MRVLHVVSVSVVLLAAGSGCSKLKSAASGGDGGAMAAPAADSPLAFLSGFEGEIDATAKEGKPGAAPLSLTVFVKSDKLRFQIPEQMAAGTPFGAQAYVIFDSPAKKVDIVSDAQKQVIVIDLNKSGEQLRGFTGGPPGPPHAGGGGAPQGPPTKLTKTGKFDTVAGYKCENWDITSDHREGTICVAQQGVSWFSIPMTGIPTETLWMADLLDGKHFPLRFVGYQKDGTTEDGRLEVTKIDKKTLPDTEFTVPPTYKVVDLGQLFQGLGALPGAGARPGYGPHPEPHRPGH